MAESPRPPTLTTPRRGLAVHPSLVPSGRAAQALGISRQRLHQLRRARRVLPAAETAEGHARWDIEELREQLRGRLRNADDPSRH